MKKLLKLISVTGIQRSEPKCGVLGRSSEATRGIIVADNGPDDDDCNPNDCDDD